MTASVSLPAAPLVPLEDFPEHLRGSVLAIGNFDGMHQGHHALFDAARAEAARRGAPALMLTFEPHPRAVLRPDLPLFRLTPLDTKARLAAAFGLDGVVVVAFNRAFAETSAADFVSRILVERLGIAAVVVGHDFQFGHDRLGTPNFLAREGSRCGFATDVIDAVTSADGAPYSATSIRLALESGDVATANRELGYRWFVTGTVQHGDKRGRELGYPTANVRLPADCGLALGIYAVTLTRADGTTLPAVASYGKRPTFDNGAVLLEVHVFDFASDLYGEEVAVTFHAFLRGEERFTSIEALIAQMDRDSIAARAILAAAGPGSAVDRALANIAPPRHVAQSGPIA
ncbi:bifunctional riboflavin kinase/FAD synthetase [Kaistia dalseonensis]|uniref:Riboflavin biosynthesis protein n=1 Tax=Kaistia dalseonensis TaxID=410840 RepID=A0ABU0HDQ9_9HYPH|nr:bifunctional riboflavin kinase/FAD synthetase [Kaistia dalseonensis]MCX5497341.1 bifunctional riboflavin kinase/FAD synthetase [Kaistia dalseonensis]MDQ0439978.1 riboflavin kinase/FMN adenylyltransferase [Kaistia dalseonensis]